MADLLHRDLQGICTPLNVSHENILKAIKERDPRKAADLMEEHLTDVIENVGNFTALQMKLKEGI
jgi:DNA-binding GntR family transcriptional regulator